MGIAGQVDTQRTRSEPSRVVIVDDQELVRAGLRAILSMCEGVNVVGEASSGEEALPLCRSENPDLVLMDIEMPGMDGLATTRAVKALHPRTAVIIVTGDPNPNRLLEALKAGAAGYLQKGATVQAVIDTVQTVIDGGSLLDADLAARLLKRLALEEHSETKPAASPVLAPFEQLTRRETEVLTLLARGWTNNKIATELYLSLSTVKKHVEHVIGKLGVSDRTQAAVRGIQLRLVVPEND